MAFTITATASPATQVKIVDDVKNSIRYFMNSTHTAQINADSGMVIIINLETNSPEYTLDPDLVTTPAGPWTAEDLADTLNATPYFFKSAGGSGGSVSPGDPYQVFRTDSAGTATEWTPWLTAEDNGANEVLLRFDDPDRDVYIKRVINNKEKLTINYRELINDYGGQIDIEDSGDVILKTKSPTAQCNFTLNDVYGGAFSSDIHMTGLSYRVWSQQIDALIVQDNYLFTNSSPIDFFITKISYFPTAITGLVASDGTFSMGVTAPLYADEVLITASGDVWQDVYFNGGNAAALHRIQPASDFYLSVKSIDSTATELKFQIVIEGYYFTAL